MRLIQPNCRLQLTGADVDFILETLQPGLKERDGLERLLADEESRDLILDDPELCRAILEQQRCLSISPHLYFYVLVRRVFGEAGLAENELADYVAELLAEFSRSERLHFPLTEGEECGGYFCDLLAALQQADDLTRFYLRVHIGNASLFVSGIFPDQIRYREERRGAPGLAYYESLGQANFRAASDHRLALKYRLADVYQRLADRFRETRQALNELGDRLVSLGDPDPSAFLLDLDHRAPPGLEG